MEAKVAMDIAQVDGTLEFTLGLDTEHSNGNPKTTTMKLDEAPVEMKEALLRRIKALSRTGNSSRIYLSFSHFLVIIFGGEKKR